MQYKIIVDKQSRDNPSTEKKEYIINTEELRVKGDIYDSIIITKNEDYVLRRLELTKYKVLKVLKEPIKEPLDINIELFEGNNYIYLSNLEGNKFYAEYLIKNDFTDLYVTINEMNSAINQSATQIELSVNQKLNDYSTTEEMNALIQLLSEQINLELSKKVGDQEIISKLNMTTEKIKILSKLIELEGYTTINGGFSIDEQGNASIANGSVKINNNGIELADGKKVIGGDGIYCNLQFFPPIQYAECGYIYRLDMDCSSQQYLNIYADIPKNFVIESAYITLRHQPVTWNYWDMSGSGRKETVGYSRNVQIYTDDLIPREYVYVDSETLAINEMPGIKTTAMGNSGKTFSSTKIEVAISSNLKQYLKPGEQTVFHIGSTTKASSVSSIVNAYAQTGYIMATLNVLGYLRTA